MNRRDLIKTILAAPAALWAVTRAAKARAPFTDKVDWVIPPLHKLTEPLRPSSRVYETMYQRVYRELRIDTEPESQCPQPNGQPRRLVTIEAIAMDGTSDRFWQWQKWVSPSGCVPFWAHAFTGLDGEHSEPNPCSHHSAHLYVVPHKLASIDPMVSYGLLYGWPEEVLAVARWERWGTTS